VGSFAGCELRVTGFGILCGAGSATLLTENIIIKIAEIIKETLCKVLIK